MKRLPLLALGCALLSATAAYAQEEPTGFFPTGFDTRVLTRGQTLDEALTIYLPRGSETAPACGSLSCVTAKNLPISQRFDIGQDAQARLLSRPRKGQVTLMGDHFLYRPYAGQTGSDRFTYCAVDRSGNYSAPAVVEIAIEREELPTFDDLTDSRIAYPAAKLCEAGVLSGEASGNGRFFYPQRTVTAAEFLVMTLAAVGEDEALPVCINTGLPQDGELPGWLKPYLQRAMELGILQPGEDFDPQATPTRAQAVVWAQRAASPEPVERYNLQLTDLAQVPAEAMDSYLQLAAAQLLRCEGEAAKPLEPLDRAYAAELLWPVCDYCQ